MNTIAKTIKNELAKRILPLAENHVLTVIKGWHDLYHTCIIDKNTGDVEFDISDFHYSDDEANMFAIVGTAREINAFIQGR